MARLALSGFIIRARCDEEEEEEEEEAEKRRGGEGVEEKKGRVVLWQMQDDGQIQRREGRRPRGPGNEGGRGIPHLVGRL